MSKVTDEMVAAGAATLRQITSAYSQAEAEAISLRIHNAMRAARPRKQRKAEDAPKPVEGTRAVAEALYNAASQNWQPTKPWLEMSDDGHGYWMMLARHAIAAMGAATLPEEATLSMERAAFEAHRDTQPPRSKWQAIWRAQLAAWREETK